MEQPLLTIGRFAQLTGLTVRALRLYDEQDLLRPESVDSHSGYRLYAPAQLDRGGLIARLRRLDMPLERIRRYLDAPADARSTVLREHREHLTAVAATTAESMRALDEMLKELAMPGHRPHRLTSMVVKTLRDQPALRIRFVMDDAMDPGVDIGEVFAVLEEQGLAQAGPPYFTCAEPDATGDRHAEVGIPVDRPGTADGRVEVAVLPGGDVASVLYRGPYPTLDVAYRRLWTQMQDAGLTPAGDPRNQYLTNPDATPDPEDYFTEVLWPIQPAGSAASGS